MPNATITNLAQTERNGLFSLTFEGEALSEYEKFIERFKNEADVVRDLNIILAAIQRMLEGAGFPRTLLSSRRTYSRQSLRVAPRIG